MCFHIAGVCHIGSQPNFSRFIFRQWLAISCLIQARHYIFNLDIYPDVVLNDVQLILIDDFLRYLKQQDSHVLILIHGDNIVEILQFHSNELPPQCGYNSVHEYFCCQQGGTLCSSHPFKIEAIPSHIQLKTSSFLFMRLNFIHDPSISYFFVFWHTIFVDGENCVVTSRNSGTNYLS